MISGAFKCDGIGFELSVPEKFEEIINECPNTRIVLFDSSSKQASNASDFVANDIDVQSFGKYTEFPDTLSKSPLDISEVG